MAEISVVGGSISIHRISDCMARGLPYFKNAEGSLNVPLKVPCLHSPCKVMKTHSILAGEKMEAPSFIKSARELLCVSHIPGRSSDFAGGMMALQPTLVLDHLKFLVQKHQPKYNDPSLITEMDIPSRPSTAYRSHRTPPDYCRRSARRGPTALRGHNGNLLCQPHADKDHRGAHAALRKVRRAASATSRPHLARTVCRSALGPILRET